MKTRIVKDPLDYLVASTPIISPSSWRSTCTFINTCRAEYRSTQWTHAENKTYKYIVVIHPQYRTGVFLKRPEHTKFSVILKVWLQSKFFQNFYHICESCTVKVATLSGHIAGQQLMAHGSRAHYSEQDLRSYWEPNSLNSGWDRQNPRATTPTDRPQNKQFMAWQHFEIITASFWEKMIFITSKVFALYPHYSAGY